MNERTRRDATEAQRKHAANLREVLARAAGRGDARATAAALEALFRAEGPRPSLALANAAAEALFSPNAPPAVAVRREEGLLLLRALAEHAEHDRWADRSRRQALALLRLALLARGAVTDRSAALESAHAAAHDPQTADCALAHAAIASLCLTRLAANGEEDEDDDDEELLREAEESAERALELGGWRGLDECAATLAALRARRGDAFGAADALRRYAERGGPCAVGALRMRAEHLRASSSSGKKRASAVDAVAAHVAWALADPTADAAAEYVFARLADVAALADGAENPSETLGSVARLAALRLGCCAATAWRPWADVARLATKLPEALEALQRPPWRQACWQRLHLAPVPSDVLEALCSNELLCAKAAAAELLLGRGSEYATWWRTQACGRCGLDPASTTADALLGAIQN